MASLTQLTIDIKGVAYGVETFLAADTGNRVVRLTSGEKVYDVEQGAERTTCTCPDFTFRHAGLPYSVGCKHVQAAVAAGLVVNVAPFATHEASQGTTKDKATVTA